MNDVEKVQEIIKDHTLDDERRFDLVAKDLKVISEKLDQVLQIYDGLNFVGKFLVKTGILAGSVTAIAALGYTLIHFIRGK